MRLEDFDYPLPPELIALRPVRPRPAARLLVAEPAAMIDSTVARLGDWLRPGDLLVLNDTKVIAARLSGVRQRAGGAGSAIEATLLSPAGDGAWWALARPGKRLAIGDRVDFGGLVATVRERQGAEVLFAFEATGADFDAALAATGAMPLPPYIAARRAADAQDREDYQTVFATRPGAVAAPTASLHFDTALLEALAARGVGQARVTLHVGAGTFLPVKTEAIDEHRMHAEWGEIGAEAAEAINAAIAAGGRVIPVGTTALRLIETAAVAEGRLRPWVGETDIFIRPGFAFRIAGALMTNFHLPKSTLLMLVAAFVGFERMQAIYAHAVAERYRFFSYGDASLLFPAESARCSTS